MMTLFLYSFFLEIVQRFNDDNRRPPFVVVWDASTNTFWKQTLPIHFQNIQAFLDDIIHGKVEGHPLPRVNLLQEIFNILKHSFLVSEIYFYRLFFAIQNV
jgi:hypothetical protein